MAPQHAWLYFDESGGFEGGEGADPWTIVALAGVGPQPNRDFFLTIWRGAWNKCALPTPDYSSFHATHYPSSAHCALVADQIFTTSNPRYRIAAIGGHCDPAGDRPQYVECVVEICARVGSQLFLARPERPALVLTIGMAYRDPLNARALARQIRSRIVERLAAAGRNVPSSLTVLIHTAPVNREPAWVISDLLCNSVYRALKAKQSSSCSDLTMLDGTTHWRLPAAVIRALKGFELPGPSPSEPVDDASAILLTTSFDAEYLACELAEGTGLAAGDRLALLLRLVAYGDSAFETRRDRITAARAAELTDFLFHDERWTDGWSELDHYECDLRIESLFQVMENHAGTLLEESNEAEMRAKMTALLAKERAVDAVMLYENRRCIGLTNAFRFDEARERLAIAVDFLRKRHSHPFGAPQPVQQLGEFLGSLGQAYALSAMKTGDWGTLSLAEASFIEARANFVHPADIQRQGTYLLHLAAERLRYAPPDAGGETFAAAQQFDKVNTRAACARMGTLDQATVGDAFRVHAWVKLCALSGENPMLDPATVNRLTINIDAAHPAPLCAAWLDQCLLVHRAGWRESKERAALLLQLWKWVAEGGLLGWLLRFVLLDSVPPAERPEPASFADDLPQSNVRGWAECGAAAQLAKGWQANPRASSLIPFNFC